MKKSKSFLRFDVVWCGARNKQIQQKKHSSGFQTMQSSLFQCQQIKCNDFYCFRSEWNVFNKTNQIV